MKNAIKKIICLAAVAMGISMTASADTERAIDFSQLPNKAQQTVSSNFGDKKVALVKVEEDFLSKSYDVYFTDGTKIEFDGSGQWTEIDCDDLIVPSALIPEGILAKVKELYPDAAVNEIEREKRGYEVKLSNRMKLKFDPNCQLYSMKSKYD